MLDPSRPRGRHLQRGKTLTNQALRVHKRAQGSDGRGTRCSAWSCSRLVTASNPEVSGFDKVYCPTHRSRFNRNGHPIADGYGFGVIRRARSLALHYLLERPELAEGLRQALKLEKGEHYHYDHRIPTKGHKGRQRAEVRRRLFWTRLGHYKVDLLLVAGTYAAVKWLYDTDPRQLTDGLDNVASDDWFFLTQLGRALVPLVGYDWRIKGGRSEETVYLRRNKGTLGYPLSRDVLRKFERVDTSTQETLKLTYNWFGRVRAVIGHDAWKAIHEPLAGHYEALSEAIEGNIARPKRSKVFLSPIPLPTFPPPSVKHDDGLTDARVDFAPTWYPSDHGKSMEVAPGRALVLLCPYNYPRGMKFEEAVTIYDRDGALDPAEVYTPGYIGAFDRAFGSWATHAPRTKWVLGELF